MLRVTPMFGLPSGPGQIVFSNASGVDTEWVVPTGVTSISAIAVGVGGSSSTRNGGAGGGALSYSNDISVTGGETLAIKVGAIALTSTPSQILRGETVLLSADNGKRPTGTTNAGAGGSSSAGVGDVRQSGGSGGAVIESRYGGHGGAAGYSGAGGGGSSGTTDNATSGAGGGGGGSRGGSSTSLSDTRGPGGGVGLQGQGASGAAATVVDGAGGDGSGGGFGQGGKDFAGAGPGAVRIIWGEGRSFPNNAEDV